MPLYKTNKPEVLQLRKNGHIARDCRNPSMDQRICNACGRRGHGALNCEELHFPGCDHANEGLSFSIVASPSHSAASHGSRSAILSAESVAPAASTARPRPRTRRLVDPRSQKSAMSSYTSISPDISAPRDSTSSPTRILSGAAVPRRFKASPGASNNHDDVSVNPSAEDGTSGELSKEEEVRMP
ncbi:hypothetical protein BDV18DRAFT_162714 [Aspergillus unguis]